MKALNNTSQTFTADSGVSYSEQLASCVGLRAAVLYENIRFWVELNRKKGLNLKDGRTWTYQSVREISEQITGLSSKEIRGALSKLEEMGFIITGFFGGHDRKKWYALTSDKQKKTKPAEKPKEPKKRLKPAPPLICPKGQEYLPKGENVKIQNKIQRVSKGAETSRDELLSLFSDAIKHKFNRKDLDDHADDYLSFCRHVNGRPTAQGFRNKLIAKLDQARTTALNSKAREDLSESKRDKLAALTMMNMETAVKIESMMIADFAQCG